MSASLRTTLIEYGYRIYTRPYELNIVGVRSDSTSSGRFDDTIEVFYNTDDGTPLRHSFKATTDPGTYWLQNMQMPQGTAILKAGQYENCYQLGLHKGSYRALVQLRPVTVVRDYDRNAVLDFYNGTAYTGFFGINIHRAVENGIALLNDKASAGCQVFSSSGDYDAFISLCDKHAQRYGNQFTYTLIDERAVKRKNRKRLLLAAAAMACGGITTALIANHYSKKYESIPHHPVKR